MSNKLDSARAASPPAEKYAGDVAAGRIVASKWVRLACERHLRDLRTGRDRGLVFDRAAAQHALDFFGFLRHSKGEWSGSQFALEPWQQFIVWSLFGWKRAATGLRRFRVAHVEVARKNGKSTLCAGIGLYLFFADGEPGAEVYCAATKKDQAKIVYEEAVRMRSASPALAKRIAKFRDNMNVPGTASKFEPLGSDEDTLDGLNIHGAIVDELHAHKNRLLWDVLDTATGARRQALIFAITTAGFNRESICWSQHEYGEKVLEGIVEDDTFFPFIAALDPGDDWQDEKNWPKANPNLGVSVKLDDLRRLAHKASQDPSALNSFLRLRLNVWTSSETAAIKAEDWRACSGVAGADLAGRLCYVAIDLSSTEDVAAMVKLFPPDDEEEPYQVLCNFWVPAENVERKIAEHRVPYDVWIRQGYLQTTEGNVIDYDVIQEQLLADCERYQVREIAFDPWNATQFANNLQKAGIDPEILVKFPQTISMFAEPTKRLLGQLIPSRRLNHFANPVLAWMSLNLLVKEDNNGNRRPVRGSARGKVDGMVALIMALGRAIASPEPGGSVYETRGVLVL